MLNIDQCMSHTINYHLKRPNLYRRRWKPFGKIFNNWIDVEGGEWEVGVEDAYAWRSALDR